MAEDDCDLCQSAGSVVRGRCEVCGESSGEPTTMGDIVGGQGRTVGIPAGAGTAEQWPSGVIELFEEEDSSSL